MRNAKFFNCWNKSVFVVSLDKWYKIEQKQKIFQLEYCSQSNPRRWLIVLLKEIAKNAIFQYFANDASTNISLIFCQCIYIVYNVSLLCSLFSTGPCFKHEEGWKKLSKKCLLALEIEIYPSISVHIFLIWRTTKWYFCFVLAYPPSANEIGSLKINYPTV